MTDNHTEAARSYNMSRIRSKNTKAEECVRKLLFSKGFRYRKNVKQLPGCPDIVLPKYKTVIFVNGCFWHMHDCGRFHWPKTNCAYWEKKIRRNVERDAEIQHKLMQENWKVIVIWECETKEAVFNITMNRIISIIKSM